MDWHVQFRKSAEDRVTWHPSPEEAIEAACSLIDAGCEVFGIGTGALSDSVGPEHIARIYAIWARPNRPFGIMPG
jgi:hypothetical protein